MHGRAIAPPCWDREAGCDNAPMFSPNTADVRSFFCETYRKQIQREAMTPMETLAGDWIAQHPEYHHVLGQSEAAQAMEFKDGQPNPFLHLSMHLSIAEQCSIDQPPGIREATQRLAVARSSLHEAHHEVMECLGQILWQAQRNAATPDAAAYLECVRRRR